MRKRETRNGTSAAKARKKRSNTGKHRTSAAPETNAGM
jgi:hypothetical protein